MTCVKQVYVKVLTLKKNTITRIVCKDKIYILKMLDGCFFNLFLENALEGF